MSDVIQERLDNIVASAIPDMSLEETERFLHDLDAICLKLKNRYYRSADYVPSNQYHHRSRTTELYGFFSGYYHRSKRWTEILSSLPKDNIHSVMDLCPGWSPKLEMALRDWGFTGKVFLVDSNPAALADLQSFVDIIRVGYGVEKLCCDFFSPFSLSVDLIVGNHLLDDFLLGSYCLHHRISLDQVYESEDLFVQTVKKIVSEHEIAQSIVEALAVKLDTHINENGYAAFLHYPGKLEKGLGLYDWMIFVYKMMDDLCAQLVKRGYKVISHISHRDQILDDTSQSIFIVQSGSQGIKGRRSASGC